MNIRSCLALLAMVSLLAGPVSAANSPRDIVNLNPGWKFIRQDVAAAEVNSFDDSSWQAVDLPHTWNNLDGQDGGNNYYRGPGVYRRHLPGDPKWAGKEIYLKFDGSSIDTVVFVNGKQAGTHQGSFGAFCFDITPLLNMAADNVITVKVNNKFDRDIAPLSADFTFFGGIYRNVNLVVLNKLSISPIDNASSGIYVRQDKVDDKSANLTVTTEVQDIAESKTGVVRCELVDAAETVVATTPDAPISGKREIVQLLTVSNPHLWNGRKDPYLYHARVTLLDGSVATDIVEQPVGLRFYHVDPQLGFFLNGKHLGLHGVSRHQDRIDVGWAVSPAVHLEDFNNMMEMGCTAFRAAHYQQAQEMYDLCDKGGIVVWAEIPLVNNTTHSEGFDTNCQTQLRELIKQNFNHPSICFWGLSNELRPAGKDKAERADQEAHQVDLITLLNTEAKQLDPTRPTAQASARGTGQKLDSITDLAAFNRYYGWYDGKATDWPDALDKIHAVYPNRAVAITEYGAGSSIHQHEANVKQPKPGAKWHPEEWQCELHEHAWDAMRTRPWIWATFVWCLHDFAADQRGEGDHPGRNDKGMITYDGKTKKDVFYFYKANWSTEPVIHITDSRFTPRPIADMPIKVYSNCEALNLKLNGTTLHAGTGNDEHVFIWSKAQLISGENKLEVTGTRDGKPYSDSCVITFDPNATDGKPPATARKP